MSRLPSEHFRLNMNHISITTCLTAQQTTSVYTSVKAKWALKTKLRDQFLNTKMFSIFPLMEHTV